MTLVPWCLGALWFENRFTTKTPKHHETKRDRNHEENTQTPRLRESFNMLNRPSFVLLLTVALSIGFLRPSCWAQDADRSRAGKPATDYGRWERGIPDDPNFFPIAVWLQAPRNAAQYQKAGINLYVGLFRGPSEEQLLQLKEAGMRVICSQNDVGLQSENADVIVGWMHGDEPDNAQAKRGRKGYDPPILPSVIIENYERLRTRDSTRPIFLNLGQGVAFDDYIGRGVRRNHPEDYPEYIRGADIVSFDIYPAVHDNAQVAGKLEFVARGVERLVRWSEDKKIVWNCIECSRISNTKVKPTAEQIRSEVWMSLIHGSRGIIYFVHQFEPRFKEASLLDDEELLPAVTKLNQQIAQLAPVLNSPTLENAVSVSVDSSDAKIATMCKRHAGAMYVFAANVSPNPTKATFQTQDNDGSKADVLEESRSLPMSGHKFQDQFDSYAVHCYRISE